MCFRQWSYKSPKVRHDLLTTTTSIDIKQVQLVLNDQFEDKLYNRNSIKCSILENLPHKCWQSRLMHIKKYQENKYFHSDI